MTNRERAIEFNKSIVAELGVQPPAKGADMIWQEWCKRQAAALDAAEKRGELKGRIAEREALAARVPPGESTQPEPSETERCFTCGGRGEVMLATIRTGATYRRCDDCKGAGRNVAGAER